jgi:hypothetical protein
MRYDNDTIVSRAFNLSSSGINQIRIPELEGRKVKDIYGFFYMEPEKEATTAMKLMVIKNIQLVKFRKKELLKDSTVIGKSQPVEILKTNKL